MKKKFGRTEIELIQADITTLVVDAIVNAANRSLRGGGGVDGAIHRAGGPKILEECKRYKGLATGEAIHTTAGNMPSRYVIHTVGPVWESGLANEENLLSSCYKNSLKKALEIGAKTIAFPSISTGVYGYPFKAACEVALRTIKEFLKTGVDIDKIYLVAFSGRDFNEYEEIFGTA